MNKEIIELLKRANELSLHKHRLNEVDDKCVGCLVEQALAKLKEQQPPAGKYPNSEFIKVQRLAIESCEASYEGDEWLPIGLQRLAEACGRLDRAEAGIKRLTKFVIEILGDVSVQDFDRIVKNTLNFTDLQAKLETSESINKELLEICEEFMLLADDGSAAFDDPCEDSIYLKAIAAIAKAKKEG